MVSVKINLLTKDDTYICIIWINERPNEGKNGDNKLSGERLNTMIGFLEGVKWLKNQGFGEAKFSGKSNSNYLKSMDLIRLGMFS